VKDPLGIIKKNGNQLETTELGFLVNPNDWDEAVAEAIATQEEIKLTEQHWEIIKFIRHYYRRFNHLPNMRVFSKAIRQQLGEEKGSTRYLYRLFPDGPLKYACKIGGLPKPPNCI